MSKLSQEYGVSYDSVYNHAQHHVSYQLKTALQRQDSIESMNLLGEIEDILTHGAKRILDDAEQRDRPSLALDAIREARGSYELLSKIAFSLHQARCEEMRLQEQKDGTRAEQEFQKGLEVLDDQELRMFQFITEKIEARDSSIDAIGSYLNQDPETPCVRIVVASSDDGGRVPRV